MCAGCYRGHRPTERQADADTFLNITECFADFPFDHRRLTSDECQRLGVKRERFHVPSMSQIQDIGKGRSLRLMAEQRGAERMLKQAIQGGLRH